MNGLAHATPPERFAGAASIKVSKRLILLLVLVGTLLPLVALEIGLRAFGFSYRLYPEKIEFGWPRPDVMQSLYSPDNDLLWAQKNYQERIATLRAAPPDIIFMGDSCTEFGTYDEFFMSRAQEQFPTLKLSSAKLGVGGWSSFQGLQQMKRDIVAIKPKIATIYFGWNDHWIGFGVEDKEIAKLRSPTFTILEHLRVAQFLVKAYLTFSQGGKEAFPYRVTTADFAQNLRDMISTARSAGITPVLLTAPSSHRTGKEPKYLLKRHLKDLSQLVPLHQSYVAVVRQVAKESGAPLCDLEQDFAKFSEEQLQKLFNSDGIHLTKAKGEGYDFLAGFMLDCISKTESFKKLQ